MDGLCVEGEDEGLDASGACVLDGLEEDGLASDGAVDGLLEDGVCCAAGGISGAGAGCVCGVCWSGDVDGVDWAFSALPQEIIPKASARVARNESD